MDRDELIEALQGGGAASSLCREALLAGAGVVFHSGLVATADLRTIYRRRAEHLSRLGIEAVDAEDAADKLDRTTHGNLAIARVESPDGRHFFQVFLDPARQHVVACLAVPDETGGSEPT